MTEVREFPEELRRALEPNEDLDDDDRALSKGVPMLVDIRTMYADHRVAKLIEALQAIEPGLKISVQKMRRLMLTAWLGVKV